MIGIDFQSLRPSFSFPMERLKIALRHLVVFAARWLGSPVRDQRTGQVLGRAMILAFRGKVHVIGLEAAVRPVFLPQDRLAYWRQEMGFATLAPPDFPHEPRP